MSRKPNMPRGRFVVRGATGNAVVEGDATAVGVEGNLADIPPGVIMDIAGADQSATVKGKSHAIGVKETGVTKDKVPDDVVEGVTFDNNTYLLILSGYGDGSDVFEATMSRMQAKFIELGIHKDKIWNITPKPERKTTTWSNLTRAFEDISVENPPKFIFYFCGHFSLKKTFLIDKEDKDDGRLASEKLADQLNAIQCQYLLVVLDMCYAESFEMDEEDELDPENVPDLWSLLLRRSEKGAMAHVEEGEMADVQKVVIWSSSQAHEKAKYESDTKETCFGGCLLQVFENQKGMTKSVWDLNALVTQQLQYRNTTQTPQVQPKEECLHDFPEFDIR